MQEAGPTRRARAGSKEREAKNGHTAPQGQKGSHQPLAANSGPAAGSTKPQDDRLMRICAVGTCRGIHALPGRLYGHGLLTSGCTVGLGAPR